MEKNIKISDIIKLVAIALNMGEVVDYLKSPSTVTGEGKQMAEKLLSITEMLVSETAIDQFPVVRTDSGYNKVGKTSFVSLAQPPVKILDVIGVNQKSLEYELQSDGFVTKEPVVKIIYQYIPANLKIDTTLIFNNPKVNASLFAKGVIAEYLLSIFDFDGAVAWHERFIKTVKKCFVPTNVKTPKRSWV